MFNKMMEKRAELKATLKEKRGLQKGFTLVELLVVLLILAMLIAVLVMQFSFLGKVDGTELIAESKNVESAVLQKALANDDREFPGVDTAKKVAERDSTKATANAKAVAVSKADIISFMVSKGGDKKDAEKLYGDVVKSAGSDVTEEEFAKLVYYVNGNVQTAVAGNAEVADYLVVVKKSQIATEDSDALGSYADELAGTVFSAQTVTDSDGRIYNGTKTTTK